MDMNISTDINPDDGMWLKEDTVLDGRYKIVKRVKAGGIYTLSLHDALPI